MSVMIHSSFPKYDTFDPVIPVWCITPSDKGCMHRFFDTSPISPSGRYIALFQLPYENRQPRPGEKGRVRLVDLKTGDNHVVAETCGWEPQLGANINWGLTDNQLFFNDVNTDTWQPFAWKLDPLTGKRKRLEGTVYHASPDGRWLISSNLTTMRRVQAGYGVVVPKDNIKRNLGLVDDDGFFLTDTLTGKSKLLFSIRKLLTKAKPSILPENVKNCEIYGGHCKFNPQGTRIMLSVRWFEDRGIDTWELSQIDHRSIRFAWITSTITGNDLNCALGPELFLKGGHHATWTPDGNSISLNLKLNGKSMRFVTVQYDGKNLKESVKLVRGSGHPTMHPSGNILTDTYLKKWDFPQYNDGTVPLRWINLKSGKECVLVRIQTQQSCDDPALRIDPHPAWDKTWRYIVFNGFYNGSRRVFLADMAPILYGASTPKMQKRRIGEDRLIRRIYRCYRTVKIFGTILLKKINNL